MQSRETVCPKLKRTFITNLVLLVGLNLLVKPLYLLVVEAEIQNRVGAEHFGQYFALINFSFILNIFLDLGTTNWNTRNIAKQGFVANNQFTGMIILRFFLAFVYFIVAMTIGWSLNYSSHEMTMLAVLAFNQVLVSMILYFRSYLMGMHLFRHDSIVSVLDRLLLLLIMATLLWGHIFSNHIFRIEWLIWGQTISYGVTLLVAFVLVYSQGKKNYLPEKSFSVQLALRESFPFALLILLSMLGYRIDAVMLERISGSRDAGIYAMAYRFFEAVNMIAYLFAVLLLPIFTRMLTKKEDVTPLLHLSFKVMFSGIFILSALTCFFGGHLLSLVYDQNIAEATPVFSWLMLSALFFSLQYITGTLMTASGNMKPMIWIAGLGMCYNVALNVVFIPHMGAEGAARASCFTQFIIFVAQAWHVLEKYHIGSWLSLGLRTTVFTVLCLLTGLFFSLNAYFLPSPIISITAFLILSMFLAFATGMLDYRRFIELIKSGSRTS